MDIRTLILVRHCSDNVVVLNTYKAFGVWNKQKKKDIKLHNQKQRFLVK